MDYLQALLNRYQLELEEYSDFGLLKFKQGQIKGIKEIINLHTKLERYLVDKRDGKVT
jgi:hypothetical protein